MSPIIFDQMGAAYVGYRAIARDMINLLDMIVSPDLRMNMTAILGALLLRIAELRLRLVAEKPFHVLDLSAVFDHLRLGPEAILFERLPSEFFVNRDRVNYLLKLFGSEPSVAAEVGSALCSVPVRKRIPKIPNDTRMNPELAVTKISSIYRGIMSRRESRKFALAEYQFLGLLPTPIDRQLVERSEEILADRSREARRLRLVREKLKDEELKLVRERIENEMLRRFIPESLMQIWKFKEANGRLPESIEEALSVDKTGVELQDDGKIVDSDIPLERLRSLLGKFNVHERIPLVSETEEKCIRNRVKEEILEKLNREDLSCIRARQGLKPVVKISEPDLGMDEQDLIDLMKEGIVRTPRNEDPQLVGDLLNLNPATEGSPPTIAQMKLLIMDECIIPLCCGGPCSSPLLLYGPEGCGKTTIVEWIVARSNAVLFDLTAKGATSRDTVDRVAACAKHLVPCVILIKNLNEDISNLVELCGNTKRTLIVCTVNYPLSELKTDKKIFRLKLFVNSLCELDRAAFISRLFVGKNTQVELTAVLARITEGLSTDSIQTVFGNVPEKSEICAEMFVDPLSRFDRVSNFLS